MAEECSPDLELKVNDYLSKMEQIAENRSFLPLKYFEDAQNLTRAQILQSHQQTDTLPVLQNVLLKWRNELSSRNRAAIMKWCNELLAEATASVDKKICKEIKSFTIYRQEIMTNMQLLKKKTQPYLTCEVSLLIQDVMIQKILEHAGQLHSSAMNQVQDQLKALEVENKALSIECREAKRRTSKEDTQAQRTISELREKMNLADVKYALLEQNHQQIKRQLQSCLQVKEQALSKINEDYGLQVSRLRSKLEQTSDLNRQTAKKTAYLQMELQKQKLLHQQTMLHYQQLITNYHHKEQELKEEILQVSRVSEKEIDHFKSLSTRRIEDWQQTANDFKEQLDQALKALRSKQVEALSARQSLLSLKEASRSQVDQLNKKIIHLEYRAKMYQDKQIECDQLHNRLQRLDTDLKRVQRQRDQSNELVKQYQKRIIITEQELNQVRIQLQEEKEKISNLSQSLRLERQTKIVNYQNDKETISAFTQTNQDPQREKLKAALALIREMQSDYLKLQHSAMRKTYA